MAVAAIDFALWDLYARIKNMPLWQLLGGKDAPVPIGVSLGIAKSESDFHQHIESKRSLGYKRIKLKVNPEVPLKWLAKCTGKNKDVAISVDANSSFTEDHLELLKRYDDLNLYMIEQPFAPKDLALSACLQSQIRTVLCLDESVEELAELKTAMALGSARCLNIKPARVGGLTSALALRDYCLTRGWEVWVGGLLETGIGRAHNLAFASTLNPGFPHDISECGRHGSEELIEEPFKLGPDGTLELPSGHGTGVEVDSAMLSRFTVRTCSLGV